MTRVPPGAPFSRSAYGHDASASGTTAPHRIKDLADVIELVRVAKLGLDFADQLDAWVRQKLIELWNAAQGVDPE